MQISDPLFISARLKIPAPRRRYILRKSLLDLLASCSDVSVIYICGGAGTGKTTLLTTFIRETNLQNISWLSIDRSCADRYTFWLYTAASLSPFLKDNSLFTYIKSNPDTSHIEEILRTLADNLTGDKDRYLVFDDLQYITDKSLITSLDFFLSILPDNVHIFILSREIPPVYLGRFAITGRLLFIGADELKLSEQESFDFLQNTLGLPANGNDLVHLVSYAEGWIGGLQLAAAASGTGIKNAGIPDNNQTGGKIAADYLNHEIFESLLPEEQNFLVYTSQLSYFDETICSCCIDNCTSDCFKALIESLNRKNLFLVCIDDTAGMYRYHNILSDFLAVQFARLPDEQRRQFLEKAAQAFEQRNDIPESLRLLLLAEAYDEALRIAAFPSSGTETWRFLDEVPVQELVRIPDLAFKCFLYNIGILNIRRCRILYEAFIAAYRGTTLETVIQFAQAYVIRDSTLLEDYTPLKAAEIEALPLSASTKAMIYTENVTALTDLLAYEEAGQCIDKALASAGESRAFVGAFAWGQKAQLYEETGRLNDSLACYTTAFNLYKNSPVLPGVGTNFYIGATGVYMEQMELEEAQHMLDESCRIYKKRREPVEVIDIMVTYHCAEMEFLKENAEGGKQLVNGILEKYPELNVITLGRLLKEEACADVLDHALARQFLEQIASSPAHFRTRLFMKLLEARMLALEGNSEAAFTKTDEVLAAAREHRNQLRLAEGALQKIYLLTLFPQNDKDDQKKFDLLRESIAASWENRIFMFFFLERTSVLPYLKRLVSLPVKQSGLSSGEQKFAEKAITVCTGTVSGSRQDAASSGILSVREHEVLEQLSLGITNREIADRLCISLATVKTHIINIYAKLGVSSRVMAISEAEKRGILQ
jgi:LuxR family transcriptional regulator, maltose regulon positive regulatory protein